jgi:hypothetical protein
VVPVEEQLVEAVPLDEPPVMESFEAEDPGSERKKKI